MGVGGADEGGVEVAHEALIRGWKQLREWINDDRAALRTKRRLTEAAREWAEAPPEKQDEYLFRGARLAVASEWARGKPLGPNEKAFLSASRNAAEEILEKERRRSRRFQVVAAVAVALALIASGMGLWANSARRDAERARDEKARR